MAFGHELEQSRADYELLRRTVELLPHFGYAHVTRQAVTTFRVIAVGRSVAIGKKLCQPKVSFLIPLPVNGDDKLEPQTLRVVDHGSALDLLGSKSEAIREQAEQYAAWAVEELTPALREMFDDPAYRKEQERWTAYARPLLYEALADLEGAKRTATRRALDLYAFSVDGTNAHDYTVRSTGSLGNVQQDVAIQGTRVDQLIETLTEVAGEFIQPREIARELVKRIAEPALIHATKEALDLFGSTPLRRTLRE